MVDAFTPNDIMNGGVSYNGAFMTHYAHNSPDLKCKKDVARRIHISFIIHKFHIRAPLTKSYYR